MDEIRARIATISDPRHASYIKHQLSDILLIIMCGVLSGLDTLGDLGQHRINGRIHIGGHAFCENQQDAPCFCSQGRTDSSCQAGPVSQNQIR